LNKDIFEQVLRDQLQSAQADVPANAWASIKSQIGPNALPTPPASGGFGMSFGLVAGAGLLVSLASYSTYRTNQMEAMDSAKTELHVNQDNASEQEAETIHFNEAESQIVNESEGVLSNIKPTADIAVVQKAKSSEIVHESIHSDNSAINKIEPISTPSEMDDIAAGEKSITTSPSETTNDNSAASADVNKPSQATEKPIAELETGTIEEEVEAIEAIIGASEITGYTPMKVKFDNLGEGQHYEWNFGSYGTRYEKSPEITFDEPGTYSVYLTVSNDDGDVVTDVIYVKVKEGSHLYSPTAISPNGDGMNDSYKVEAYLIESFLLMITNENGDVVFETRDVNQAWDFDQTGFDAASERYYVTYKGIGVDGKIHAKHRELLNIQQ
jgi:PKD repeat protein